jgi:CheY-like chemotaxis protein
MYRPPPLRGRPVLADKKVLLIDRCQATREVRAAVLRSRGVEVHEAEELSSARFLWQPNVYDLLMLDVRRYSPGETLEFCEQIRAQAPGSASSSSSVPRPTCRLRGPEKLPSPMARTDSGKRRLNSLWLLPEACSHE